MCFINRALGRSFLKVFKIWTRIPGKKRCLQKLIVWWGLRWWGRLGSCGSRDIYLFFCFFIKLLFSFLFYFYWLKFFIYFIKCHLPLYSFEMEAISFNEVSMHYIVLFGILSELFFLPLTYINKVLFYFLFLWLLMRVLW